MITPESRSPLQAVIDASSAILLSKAGLMDACCAVLPMGMTRAVLDEVAVPGRPGADRIRRLAGASAGLTLLSDPVGRPSRMGEDILRLHRGERDTLHHYFNGAARFVIIDDGRGLRVCRRYAVPHINALLCPRLLSFCGRIGESAAQRGFDRIAALGRYSPAVVAWAAACRPAALDFFMAGCR